MCTLLAGHYTEYSKSGTVLSTSSTHIAFAVTFSCTYSTNALNRFSVNYLPRERSQIYYGMEKVSVSGDRHGVNDGMDPSRKGKEAS